MLLVSHDRRFLENVTTRIVHVREGRADVYPGGFKDYEAASRKETKAKAVTSGTSPAQAGARSKADNAAGKDGKKEAARQKFDEQRQAAGALEKKKRRVAELEAAIAAGEKDLGALRGKIRQGPGQDWEMLAKMAHEEQALTKKVDAMLLEWARLSEEVQ